MTAKELIGALQTLSPETLVVLAKDAEGNGYSPLAHHGSMRYIADTPYSGDAYFAELTPELAKQGYTEEDFLKEGGESAIVLWPVN